VIIPTFNAEAFVANAYDSLLQQTLTDFEILFVDDASRDNTLSVLRSIANRDERVKIVELKSNGGPSRARNEALEVARGDWVALLDADDRYDPRRLEVVIDAAEKCQADIVLDNLYIINPVNGESVSLAFDRFGDEVIDLPFRDFLSNIQLSVPYDFGYLKPTLRKSWLDKSRVRYRENLRQGEDVMLLLDCYAHNPNVILMRDAYYFYQFPYDQRTQEKSSTTRTDTNYQKLLSATEEFYRNRRAKLSRQCRKLLAARCEALRGEIMVQDLRSNLYRSNFLGMCSAVTHPLRSVKGIYSEKRRAIMRRRLGQSFRGETA
jgi:succinoglycan biosynthesis protein ExoO